MLSPVEEVCRLERHTTIKNCYVKCDSSNDRISSSDDSAVKLTEAEEEVGWHRLQSLGVQSEDYTT